MRVPIKVIKKVIFWDWDKNFNSDYCAVYLDVTWNDGSFEQYQFGDDYHDKGDVKANAYIEAWRKISSNFEYEVIQEATYGS